VPGEGSPDAKIVFIGEGPGYHEDQQGRPFVGNSGQLLNQLLDKIKIRREDVFITNVVKCRPPNNRDPQAAELEACKSYLDRQIAAINPRLIITLGRFSMARYWPGQRISQVHGQAKIDTGRMYMPMFHPAHALRDTSPDRHIMTGFKKDGLSIPELLAKAEELASTELWGYIQPEAEIVPPSAPAVALSASLAEPKGSYRSKKPLALVEKPLEDLPLDGHRVLPPLIELVNSTETLETTSTENGLAEEKITKPPRVARKPRKLKENVANGEVVVSEVEENRLQEPIQQLETTAEEKPVITPTRRKKKETDAFAEQLTMF